MQRTVSTQQASRAAGQSAARWAVLWICLSVWCLPTPRTPLAAADGPDFAVYPGPAESYRSNHFKAEVIQPGSGAGASTSVDAFVMHSVNAWKKFPRKDGSNYELSEMSKENHWLALTSKDAVTVRLTDLKEIPVKVDLLPATGATAKVLNDGRIEITVDAPAVVPAAAGTPLQLPRYFWVRIHVANVGATDPARATDCTASEQTPFLLFVDPPEKNIPVQPTPDAPGDPKLRYFAPGVHNIGAHYKLGEGETMYIAGGAIVRGTIEGTGKNIRILGRGILSGELLQDSWIEYKRNGNGMDSPALKRPDGWTDPWGGCTMIGLEQAPGALIDGPVIIDAPMWTMHLNGAPDSTVRCVKELSWNYSTDGVSPGANTTIDNCFFKVNDDVFTLYQSKITIRNVVIWKQMNASVFQLGYGYNGNREGIRISNIEVVRDETDVQILARGVVTMAASKGNQFLDLQIDGLRIDGDTLCLFAIDNLDKPTPWSAEVKDVKLGAMEFHLKNVTITGTERGAWGGPFADRKKQPMQSRLRSEKTGTITVDFEQVFIDGKHLAAAVDFPNGLETAGTLQLTFK